MPIHPAIGAATAERGSGTQRRRERVLDATLALAANGGYGAVHMRAVAQRADLAVGTLYRYFPSKVHLLNGALGRELERSEATLGTATISAANPSERLNRMISHLNFAMQREPLLVEAMIRALVFADASAAGEVDQVSKLIVSMFARAISGGGTAEDHNHVARVISDVG